MLPASPEDAGSVRLRAAVTRSEALIASTLSGLVAAVGDSRTGAELRPMADLYGASTKASHPKLLPVKASKWVQMPAHSPLLSLARALPQPPPHPRGDYVTPTSPAVFVS